MNLLKDLFHRACHAAGVDIRLKRNLARNKALEATNRWRSHWDPLIRQFGIRTLFDVGAHTGQFARMIRVGNPELRLVCFEPLAESFGPLQETCRQLGRAECHQVALGAQDGEMTIRVSSFRPSSSILPMLDLHKKEWPLSADHTNEVVKVRRLDGFIDPMVLPDPLAVKIDVQGYESHVIAGGTGLLGLAAFVVVETSFVPLYEGQPLFADVYRQMISLGFAYGGAVETSRSKVDGCIMQEDALFVRESFAKQMSEG